VHVLDPGGRLLLTDPDLRVRTVRLGADGRGAAIAQDGAVLDLEMTPP
jgi:hypothetical protein